MYRGPILNGGRDLNGFKDLRPLSILGVDEGSTGANGNNRLRHVDAVNARRQLVKAGQRAGLGIGHGPRLVSGDGLGHLSDPGDPPGRKPISQPVVGSHGARTWGAQRHRQGSWLRETSRARNPWWLWKSWGDRRGRWASELSTGLARRQLPRLNCTIPAPPSPPPGSTSTLGDMAVPPAARLGWVGTP